MRRCKYLGKMVEERNRPVLIIRAPHEIAKRSYGGIREAVQESPTGEN